MGTGEILRKGTGKKRTDYRFMRNVVYNGGVVEIKTAEVRTTK